MLHGAPGTGAGIRNQSRMAAASARHGMLVAYPDGENGRWRLNPEPSLLANVGFVVALVAHLIDEWNVAPGQVYAAGWSNGAELSYRLAVEAPEVFAAIAPISGNFHSPPETLSLSSPVSVVGVVGRSDRAVVSEGSLQRWRELLDCPAGAPTPVAGTDHVTRIEADCADGSQVVEYQLAGVGHVWPNHDAHGFATNDAIWEFFQQHRRD